MLRANFPPYISAGYIKDDDYFSTGGETLWRRGSNQALLDRPVVSPR